MALTSVSFCGCPELAAGLVLVEVVGVTAGLLSLDMAPLFPPARHLGILDRLQTPAALWYEETANKKNTVEMITHLNRSFCTLCTFY